MDHRHEEIRLIIGMAGVVVVTMIALLTPLISDVLERIRL
jgi:hypothetical protein